MRALLLCVLCCCSLCAEATVEIPIDWLAMLQIPLVNDDARPTDQLSKILRLSDEECDQLHMMFEDYRQDLLDNLVQRARVRVATEGNVQAVIPALGADLESIVRIFEGRVQGMLGERYAVLQGLRQSASVYNGKIHRHQQDRLQQALCSNYDVKPEIEVDLSFTQNGDNWEFSRQYTSNGRNSGSSRSTMSKLQNFQAMLYERLLSKGADAAE